MGENLVGDMSYENHGTVGFDDGPVCYGRSKLPCRGPLRNLSEPYVAILGGTETYGKFVNRPFASLLEDALQINCVNLGSVNAGIDSFVNDADVIDIAAGAEVCVIQVLGAQNLSNRYYKVHARRNDRFIGASEVLRSIYEDVDFTDFSFNKHMLGTLKLKSGEKFDTIRRELQSAWLGRMQLLLGKLPRKPVLLWLRYAHPVENGVAAALGPKPPLITEGMISELAPRLSALVEVSVEPARDAGDLMQMTFPGLQIAAAEHMLGPETHQKIADALDDVVPGLLKK